MIYSLPKFFPAGDRYIEVELGDEMSFELNFLVHTLCASIRAATLRQHRTCAIELRGESQIAVAREDCKRPADARP